MPEYFAYVTEKVTQDDVASAIEEARVKAVQQLGSNDIHLYEKSWTPNWICTTWRRCVPDPVSNP